MITVDELMAEVRSHPVIDDREALSQQIMVHELARLDRPFDETADLTHVTASAVVVGPRGVVLHRHRLLHRWLQPGGHLEPGEGPEEAVVREVVEETGLDAVHPPGGPVLLHLDVHTAARGHVHLDLRYLLVAPDQDPSPGPGESQEVGWFSWDAAEAVGDEALVGALRAARSLSGPADPAGRRGDG